MNFLNRPWSSVFVACVAIFAVSCWSSTVSIACADVQPEKGEAHVGLDDHTSHSHADVMHFLHPLMTESPLPENEVRIQLVISDEPDADTIALIGTVEIAPVRWFSVEVTTSLIHADPEVGRSNTRVGNVGVGLKFASFAFEEQGLLLSAGLEIGLPTGNEERGIGNDHVIELEPWVGFGLKCDRLEWLTRVGVGVPLNQNGDREADVELEWSMSLLYHILEDRLAALIELDGVSIFGEAEDGFNSIAVTPGVRLFPFRNPHISLGAGVRLPLTDDRDSHVQGIFTLFLHY